MTLPPGVPGRAQLTLAFPLNSQSRFSNFVATGNEELVRRLQEISADQRQSRGYFLWGEAGVGKTHLLQAALQAASQSLGEADRSAIYLPLGDSDVVPEVLDGLERLALVALDDLDAWVGEGRREQALMALYQGLAERGGRLLVAATRRELNFRYADLASRLRGLTAYPVRPLDDAGKALVLRRLAGERGLALDGAVLDFWLARGSRALADLVRQLEVLDQAAMQARRRITVPLLKQVLDL
jgi:DnaA family protein